MPRFLASLAGTALAILFVASSPAAAHASLVRTDPADGSTIGTVPREVSLTFNEAVGNGFVAVTAPDGQQVETSDVRTVDEVLSAHLAPTDERGRYTVAYRVVSADGHPVSGEITFTTSQGRKVQQADSSSPDSFVHRHQGHLVLGLAVAVLAIGLILAPLRHRRKA